MLGHKKAGVSHIISGNDANVVFMGFRGEYIMNNPLYTIWYANTVQMVGVLAHWYFLRRPEPTWERDWSVCSGVVLKVESELVEEACRF